MSCADDRSWPTRDAFVRVRAPPLIVFVANDTALASALALDRATDADALARIVRRRHVELRPAAADDVRHGEAAVPPSSSARARLLVWFAVNERADSPDVRVPFRADDTLLVYERDSRRPVASMRVVGEPEQADTTGRMYVDVERWASARGRSLLSRYAYRANIE